MRHKSVRLCGATDNATERSIALGESDAELLAIVNRGEYAINGLRNRHVRDRLYVPTNDKRRERQTDGRSRAPIEIVAGTRFDRQVSKTHRYVVTEKGRRIITALLAARQASTQKLTALAA